MEKQIKTISEILRFSGFKAKADYQNGVIKIDDLTEEKKAKINSIYPQVKVVAA